MILPLVRFLRPFALGGVLLALALLPVAQAQDSPEEQQLLTQFGLIDDNTDITALEGNCCVPALADDFFGQCLTGVEDTSVSRSDPDYEKKQKDACFQLGTRSFGISESEADFRGLNGVIFDRPSWPNCSAACGLELGFLYCGFDHTCAAPGSVAEVQALFQAAKDRGLPPPRAYADMNTCSAACAVPFQPETHVVSACGEGMNVAKIIIRNPTAATGRIDQITLTLTPDVAAEFPLNALTVQRGDVTDNATDEILSTHDPIGVGVVSKLDIDGTDFLTYNFVPESSSVGPKEGIDMPPNSTFTADLTVTAPPASFDGAAGTVAVNVVASNGTVYDGDSVRIHAVNACAELTAKKQCHMPLSESEPPAYTTITYTVLFPLLLQEGDSARVETLLGSNLDPEGIEILVPASREDCQIDTDARTVTCDFSFDRERAFQDRGMVFTAKVLGDTPANTEINLQAVVTGPDGTPREANAAPVFYQPCGKCEICKNALTQVPEGVAPDAQCEATAPYYNGAESVPENERQLCRYTPALSVIGFNFKAACIPNIDKNPACDVLYVCCQAPETGSSSLGELLIAGYTGGGRAGGNIDIVFPANVSPGERALQMQKTIACLDKSANPRLRYQGMLSERPSTADIFTMQQSCNQINNPTTIERDPGIKINLPPVVGPPPGPPLVARSDLACSRMMTSAATACLPYTNQSMKDNSIFKGTYYWDIETTPPHEDCVEACDAAKNLVLCRFPEKRVPGEPGKACIGPTVSTACAGLFEYSLGTDGQEACKADDGDENLAALGV